MTFNPSLPGHVLDRLDDKWGDSIEAEQLPAVSSVTGSTLDVVDGEMSYTTDADAVNLMTLVLFNPRDSFEALREEASHSGDEITEHVGRKLVNAPTPIVAEEEIDGARTLGFVRGVAHLTAEMMNLGADGETTLQAYLAVARTAEQLNVGVNPIRPVKEVYVTGRPVRVLGDEDDVETDENRAQSAAEVSW